VKTLSIVVTTPPYSPLTATAIDYIYQAMQSDITIVGVFFYQDGVLNASKHLSIPNDEYQTTQHWQKISQEHNVPLHVCITACEKRGLSDEIETDSSDKTNIKDCFTISGLGELVELTTKSQRMVQF